jgi:transposase
MSLPASSPPSRLISDELWALVEPLIPPQRLLRHARPETILASYDITGDALERHASHQVAGWAG